MVILFVLFFSQTIWAADEYGTFMIVEGQVFIENTLGKVKAKVSSRTLVGDTITTENEARAKIVMSDRNVIVVAPNSRLKIEKYSSAPKDKNVELYLSEGSVQTDVDVDQIYDDENKKFEVRTPVSVAGVRGTQFVTTYDKETESAEVVTLEGRVKFAKLLAAGAKQFSEDVVYIQKGERSFFRRGDRPFRPQRLSADEFKRRNLKSLIEERRENRQQIINKNILQNPQIPQKLKEKIKKRRKQSPGK